MACATIDFTDLGGLVATSFPNVDGVEEQPLLSGIRKQL